MLVPSTVSPVDGSQRGSPKETNELRRSPQTPPLPPPPPFLANPRAGYTELNLRDKRIGPQGGVAIGESLQTNKSLLELDLAGNKLGPGQEGKLMVGGGPGEGRLIA